MTKNIIALPPEIKKTDLKYPSWKAADKNKYNTQFDLWYTERFGWCIPTLFISRARRGSNMQDRTYGISLKGETVTMGKGPHVLRTVTVYVKNGRLEKLKKFLDLKAQGEGKAGDIRDTISTRRMNTMARRRSYGGLLGW